MDCLIPSKYNYNRIMMQCLKVVEKYGYIEVQIFALECIICNQKAKKRNPRAGTFSPR